MLRALLAWPLLKLIWVYQRFISPLTPPSCRYVPSCSSYMKTAIEVHGPVRGALMGTRRICRCHPWGGEGFDPVPGSEMDPKRLEG